MNFKKSIKFPFIWVSDLKFVLHRTIFRHLKYSFRCSVDSSSRAVAPIHPLLPKNSSPLTTLSHDIPLTLQTDMFAHIL